MRVKSIVAACALSLTFILAGPWGAEARPVLAASACEAEVACFDLSLYPAGLIGDFYLDGNLLAEGVNAARLTAAPGAPHVIEARNIQDPAGAGFGDLYLYPDQIQSNLLAGAGQLRYVVFRPLKNYVKGILAFTCDPRGRKPADNVACQVTIDGEAQAGVPAGATVSFNLPPGTHAIHTDLVGDQAGNWSPNARDDVVAIHAGRAYVQTTRLWAGFTLKGLLKIGLYPKGLVADIYVDGELVAAQSAAAEVYVASGAHAVEARAVSDPAANGAYVFADLARQAYVGAAGTRFVNLYPAKTWLAGFLSLTCQINRRTAADDVHCAVSADGADLGTVAAGQRGAFTLPVGARSLAIAAGGASGERWDGPVTAAVNILGGRTAYYTARFNLKPAAPTAPAPVPGGRPGVNHLGTEKVVIADYMLWYDASTFDGAKTWDVPADGAYNSDDFGVIQRHVAQAQQACLNGFAAHWYGPVDSRTTSNFNQLLAASGGTSLRHAIVIQTNILPGIDEQTIIDAINYLLANWSQHPNYLRLGGRPVIIFTDMPRPWGSEAAALQGWSRVRAATDPNHNTIWMAEGLYPTYNPLFDGLYVYRIDHRDYPQSWLKQKRWADGLRAVERRGGLPLGGLYFADTIAAGFDDTRAAAAGSDLRAPAPAFARDRRGGGYYADTFAATANTGGDFLFVKSFNEWIEGTEIEPGATYGDLYLNLTCQYANAYRNR